MRSLHLAISLSTEKFTFIPSQNSLVKIIYTHLSFKITLTNFSIQKPKFSSQNFSQPKLITTKRSSSILSQHSNINNSPQFIKNHNSPFMTHFLQNSLNQQQLNHSFTNSNTQGIIYHQQHNIT